MFCRNEGQHGGSAIYCKKGIKCVERTKIGKTSVSGVFECSAVECSLGKTSGTLIISVYRPPSGDINIFLNKIEQLLLNVFKENKLVFLSGDFNIELLQDSGIKTEFLSIMNSFNLNITISENTRISDRSASCIDNIFTNSDYIYALAFEGHISDHTAQKIVFEAGSFMESFPKYIRCFDVENKQSFVSSLKEQNWLDIYNIKKDDVNQQWNLFMDVVGGLFNQSFPRKLVTKKNNKKPNKAQNNIEIIECKRELDVLLTLARNNQRYKPLYNEQKKAYDKKLTSLRKNELENKVRNSDNKTKCMWAICKEISGKESTDSDIKIEGNSECIANKYNEYLLSVIPELLRKIPNVPFSCRMEDNVKSIFLRPVLPKEILEISNKLKNKHSSGIDEIPASIVKLAAPVLAHVLSYIINGSFKYGIFPDRLKIALIKPLYKKGNPKNLDSYRPISLLPGFSKIFELAMSDRLLNFLSESNIFNPCQHGFLKDKSTQTAIFDFIKYIIDHIEDGDLVLGMFLDLSKAYDCLDREILIKKLEIYGIRGNAKEWLSSYLDNRKQCVSITKNGNTSQSNLLDNKIGIAQGSILGPILFIIFVNDLSLLIKKPYQHIVKYADDTNILIGRKNVNDLLAQSEYFFNLVTDWFNKNKLILNKEKTNILMFRTKQSNAIKPATIELNKTQVSLSNNVKFLGTYINENLDWSYHINMLIKKLNSICYGVRVIGRCVNERTLRMLYLANFESVLKYGIIFWGRDSLMQSVFVVQKRVIRIITNSGYLESCKTKFKKLGILTLYGIYIYECLLFFFKYKASFNIKQQECYSTRSMDVTYPAHRLTLTEKCPHYMCLKLFNALPDKLKKIEAQKIFKKEIKKMLVNLEPYSVRDFCENV